MGFFSNYRLQARLAWAVVLVAIFLMTGIQGEVQDIAWEGDLAAVAVGRHGGVRLLDLSDPTQPHEVGHFDTLGDARAAAWMGDYLLVADGKAGLSVLDASDPTQPREVGSLLAAQPVLDVAADPALMRAYLAVAGDGVLVVDLLTPSAPKVEGQWRPEAGGAVERVVYRSGSVYAAGGSRFWGVDVSNPQSPVTKGSASAAGAIHALAAFGPDLVVGAVDTPGLRAFQTTASEQFPVSDFPPQGAGAVAPFVGQAVALYGRGAVVGSRDGGLYHVNLLNPEQPSLSQQTKIPFGATALAVQGDRLAVGMGPWGMMLFDLRQLAPQPLGWYETRGEYSPMQFLRLMRAGVADPRPFAARKSARSLLVWLGLLGAALIGRYGGAFFFAQFVLPVRTWSERWNAYRHLNLYIRGKHGPALFVENGKLIEREGEHTKRGPGVIILDTASAAMLRTKTHFTRAVGPGLVFTEQNEYVATTVPLYPRFQALGPSGEIDMDAFEEALARGEEPPFPEALETRAQTRDDVAVVARIGVAFRLDFDPPQGTQTLGKTRYGYLPDVVARTVKGIRLDPTRDADVEENTIPWDQLPAVLAVEVWREYVHKFRFNELFDPQTGIVHRLTTPKKALGEPWGETGLEIVRRFVKQRLTQEHVPVLDEVGRPENTSEISREYQMLKDRGIRVVGVSITNLQFRRSVERNLLRSWQSSWLDWAETEGRLVDEQRAYAEHRGREEGERDFALAVTHDLGRYLLGLRGGLEGERNLLRLDELNAATPDRDLYYSRAAALTWLIRGTRTLVIREPQVHKALEGVEDELTYMISYVSRLWRKWR